MPANTEYNSELKEKIAGYLAGKPNEHLRTLVEIFGVPERVITANLPKSVSVPVSDFYAIWDEVTQWEKCLFYVEHGDVVIETEGKLPKGETMLDGKLLNLCSHRHGSVRCSHSDHANESGIFDLGGHIYLDDLQAIYLVKKQLYNIDTLSVLFYGSGEGSLFGLYAGRDANRKILPSVRERFEALWRKYQDA
jgi:putative heme utilization carrier protein HutX